MDADGSIKNGMASGQFNDGTAGGEVERRDQDAVDTSQGSAFQHRRPVRVELFQIQMAVGVGEHMRSQVTRWHVDKSDVPTCERDNV